MQLVLIRGTRRVCLVLLIIVVGASLLGAPGIAVMAEDVAQHMVSRQTDLYQDVEQQAIAAQADSSQTPTEPTHELALDGAVRDWVYDRNEGDIYAITYETNKLYVIDAETLKLEKELTVGSMPTDIEQYGNELFIALSGTNGIQTVNLGTRELGELLSTSEKPEHLAVSRNDIVYTSETGKVIRYERSTGNNTALTVKDRVRYSVLRIDEINSTLYIGEYNSTGSELISMNYITDQMITDSDPRDDFEFNGPSPFIGFDGKDIYFGGSRLNGSNLHQIYGSFPRLDRPYLEAKLLDLHGSFVATAEGIFDKDHYLQIALFPVEASKALIGNGGRVILQSLAGWEPVLQVYQLDLSTPMPTLEFETSPWGSVTSSHAISSWTTDDDSLYLYLVSSETNELAVLDKSDLSLVSKQYIGSKPVDVSLYKDKLYFAFQGENRIGMLNVNEVGSDAERIFVPVRPISLVPTDGQLFFWSEQGISNLYALDGEITTKVESYRFGSDSIAYDEQANVLYLVDSRNIKTMDPATLEVWTTESVPVQCQKRLLLFEEYLYWCENRLSKNNPKTIAGKYPVQVKYVSEAGVFSEKALYNRDNYTKITGLPFEITEAFQEKDGALYLSNETQIYVFDGLDGMQEFIQYIMTPNDFMIIDEGNTPNQILGQAYIGPAFDQSHIVGYNLFFVDSNGNELRRLSTSQQIIYYDDGNQGYRIFDTIIPPETAAVSIRATYKNSELTMPATLTTLLWDSPKYFVEDLSFPSERAGADYVEGRVSWQAGDEYADTHYQLWFLGGDGSILEPLLGTIEGGHDTYQIEMSKTKKPDGAIGLALTQSREGSEAPYIQYVLFQEFISTKLKENQIFITKNAYINDVIRVNDLQVGDLIQVYTAYGELLVSGTVQSDHSAITFDLVNVGNTNEALVVTRTSPGKYESEGTVVFIPAVTGGGGVIPPGPGPNPGPNPGPGPIIPGLPGVPGLPVSKEPIEETDKDLLNAEIELIGGESIGKVGVSDEELTSRTKTEQFSADRTLRLETGSIEPIIVFELTGSGVRNLLKTSRDTRLEFTTPSGSFIIRAEELQDAIEGAGQAERFEIRLERVETSGEIKEALPQGAQLLGVPVAFEAYAIVNGKKQELNDFASYVEHVLTFKISKPSYDSLAGLMLAQDGKSYVPVPVKFEYADGVLKASLFRKGNSIYAVAKNSVSFNDLPNSAAYKKSIQFLANKMVVNGFPDGSFKPDQSVTRAEFAAMLNRALGLLPSTAPAETGFHDVKMQDWFAGNVNSAVEAGLILGYEDGSFRPADTINHQEMLTMLVRALNYAGHSLPSSAPLDAAIQEQLEDWFEPSYSSAQGVGLLKGSGDPFVFSAKAEATRQQCALLLHRMLNDILFT
jgi:hypothetical protein